MSTATMTIPMSFACASVAMGWNIVRGRRISAEAAGKRLRRYVEARVAAGAPDPTYQAGTGRLLTLRRLLAALPELDPHAPDPLSLDPQEAVNPQRLMAAMRAVADEAIEEAIGKRPTGTQNEPSRNRTSKKTFQPD